MDTWSNFGHMRSTSTKSRRTRANIGEPGQVWPELINACRILQGKPATNARSQLDWIRMFALRDGTGDKPLRATCYPGPGGAMSPTCRKRQEIFKFGHNWPNLVQIWPVSPQNGRHRPIFGRVRPKSVAFDRAWLQSFQTWANLPGLAETAAEFAANIGNKWPKSRHRLGRGQLLADERKYLMFLITLPRLMKCPLLPNCPNCDLGNAAKVS